MRVVEIKIALPYLLVARKSSDILKTKIDLKRQDS